jgi:hypothetical protein
MHGHQYSIQTLKPSYFQRLQGATMQVKTLIAALAFASASAASFAQAPAAVATPATPATVKPVMAHTQHAHHRVVQHMPAKKVVKHQVKVVHHPVHVHKITHAA